MSDTWVDVPDGSHFPIHNLPYGVFSRPGERPRVGVAIGDFVLDLAGVSAAGLLDAPDRGGVRDWFACDALNAFMAAGPRAWRATRERLTELLTDSAYADRVRSHLTPRAEVTLHLPWRVADYVDFYSSQHHAENVGRIFRPDQQPLTPNWKHLPIGYHGRAGTVVCSGTPIVRPCGQRKAPGDPAPTFGPSRRLDIEAEVGFVVGVPSKLGEPVAVERFREHVFGVVLVNDWSARDIQAWEYVPLGPFLGKSFATSVSPWVVPLDALEAARITPPAQDPEPLPYLRGGEGLDLALEIRLNGTVVSRPPFAAMYWTPAQQLAHLTVNGASLRTGDLYASGTVSGPERSQRGSLLELAWNGAEPVKLEDGSTRVFLEDGDTVSISATAPGTGGVRIGFGEVVGTIEPARR
ncbi:fumarylacetoacetase [Carbonactinospora thermoautotrophica]|uniref:fumarylacetoacetase n=1 Tax=Carbonactinospora thermoautotrophica TaxID=1469144 RepID=A0A132N728_9ACTN|nr:fumarylacetoacetase [Carbonactinospora thermoautotrophica]KWX03408.1 fumarylacetoacetase [Carbonactinospora thermoautotrophica]KWX05939.1 fumarylacetoacetase [Carbonactinospora thermoautotrophica]